MRILTANGPEGGSLDYVKKLDTVIASADIVAADSYAATLFGLNGYNDISAITMATIAGLGQSDLSKIRIEDIPVGG